MEPCAGPIKVFELSFLKKVMGSYQLKGEAERQVSKYFFCKVMEAQGLEESLGNWEDLAPLSDPEVDGI